MRAFVVSVFSNSSSVFHLYFFKRGKPFRRVQRRLGVIVSQNSKKENTKLSFLHR